MGRHSSRTDQDRLSKTLVSLPASLAFLRDAIMDIAGQDQDLLGCGEADTDAIVAAMRTRATALDPVDAAEALHIWIESLPDPNATWLGPAGFVEGFLRGITRTDLAAPMPWRPVAAGLERIALDIPSDMKTKLYVRGLELRNRDIQIIIAEVDEGDFERRMNIRKNPPKPLPLPLPWPQPTTFVEEADLHFRIGQASGSRFISRHPESHLPAMSDYLLKLSGVNLQISFFTGKKKGFDFGKYEPLLATLRLK
jgi:hypothetical protein